MMMNISACIIIILCEQRPWSLVHQKHHDNEWYLHSTWNSKKSFCKALPNSVTRLVFPRHATANQSLPSHLCTAFFIWKQWMRPGRYTKSGSCNIAATWHWPCLFVSFSSTLCSTRNKRILRIVNLNVQFIQAYELKYFCISFEIIRDYFKLFHWCTFI